MISAKKNNLTIEQDTIILDVNLFLALAGDSWPIVVLVDKKTNKVNGLFTEQL